MLSHILTTGLVWYKNPKQINIPVTNKNTSQNNAASGRLPNRDLPSNSIVELQSDFKQSRPTKSKSLKIPKKRPREKNHYLLDSWMILFSRKRHSHTKNALRKLGWHWPNNSGVEDFYLNVIICFFFY